MSRQKGSRRTLLQTASRFAVESLEKRTLLTGLNVYGQSLDESYDHTIVVMLNKNIGDSFDPQDIIIGSLSDGTIVPDSEKTTWSDGNMAYARLATPLPDGNYESDILSSGIAASDGSTLSGDAYATFYFLAGDLNHDRVIDWIDYDYWTMLSGPGYFGGDLNYDGGKGYDDYLILESKFGTTLPEAPSATNAYSLFTQGSSKIHVQWNPVEGEIEGYRVYRSLDGVNFNWITSTPESYFDDTGLSGGTKYWYRVKPFIGASYLGPSLGRVWSVTTLPAPGNLQISDVRDSRVTLTWQDNTANEGHFKIQRAIGDGEFVDFAAVNSNTTSYTATGLSEDTTYHWRVVATNDAAISAPTIEETATTKLKAPTSVMASVIESNGHLRVDWTNQSSAASENVLTRQEVDASGAVVPNTQTQVTLPATATTHEFSDTQFTKRYQVTLQAGSTGGNTSVLPAPVASDVEPANDWTTAYDVNGSPRPSPAYIDFTWSPGDTRVETNEVISIPKADGYKNETVTLTLSGLPRHTWGQLALRIITTTDGNESISATIGGQSVPSGAGGLYDTERTWYLGINSDSPETAPSAFKHRGSSIELSITGSGFPNWGGWKPNLVVVNAFLPFVSIGGPDGATEGGSATFTVVRTGNRTLLSDPLAVGVDYDGTASLAVDYSGVSDPITVAANQNLASVTAQVSIDADNEETQESIIAAVKRSSEYGFAPTTQANASGTTRPAAVVVIDGRNGFYNEGDTGDLPLFWVVGQNAGGGHGNQGIGSVQREVKPDFITGFSNGRAWARVKPATGELVIVRSFAGVKAGDQGVGVGGGVPGAVATWLGKSVCVTPQLASGLNAHELGHVLASGKLYGKTAKAAVDVAGSYRTQNLEGNEGETEAQVLARLKALIDWDARVARFRLRDTSVNANGGEFHAWETQQGGGPFDGNNTTGGVIDGTTYDLILRSRDETDPNYNLPDYDAFDPAG